MVFFVGLKKTPNRKVDDKKDLELFNIVLPVKKVSFSPINIPNAFSAHLVNNLYDKLFVYDDNLGVTPKLVENWKISNNNKTYVFNLKKNILFQNGKELKAEDVVYSLKLCFIDFVTVMCQQFKGLTDGIKATDSHSLQVTFNKPLVYFLDLLTSPQLSIIPKNYGNKSENDFNKNPIGTGKFIIHERSSSYIILKSNPLYFDKKPQISKIKFWLSPNKKIISDLIKKNELHEVNNMLVRPVPYITQLTEKHYSNFIYPSLITKSLAFNLRRKKLKDKHLRKFLGIIFRSLPLKNIFSDFHPKVATGLIPNGMKGNISMDDFNNLNLYRRDQLKNIYFTKLKKEKVSLTLVTPMSQNILTTLQEELNKLLQPYSNISIKIKYLKLDEYFSSVFSKHDYDLTFVTWGGEFPIPVFYLSGFFSTSKYNYSGVNDPHIDNSFLNSYDKDIGKIVERFNSIDKYILSNYLAVPLVYPRQKYFYPKNLKGIKPSIFGIISFSYDNVFLN